MTSESTLQLLVGLVLGTLFGVVGQRVGKRSIAAGLIIAAMIYLIFILFAHAPLRWVAIEVMGILLYGSMAWAGISGSHWWLVAGWASHIFWDLGLHLYGNGHLYAPQWYARICLGFDLIVAILIAAFSPFRPNPPLNSDPTATTC